MSALVEENPFPAKPRSGYRSSSAQKPIRNLRRAIQELHFNVTVGLLSLAPQLLYAENGTAIANTFSFENVWNYDPFVLLMAYAVAAFLDALAIAVGVLAMVQNGGVLGFEFARILSTTRASLSLDAVVGRWRDGLDPVPSVAQKTRVMYGEVTDRGLHRRVGFGLEDEVTVLK